MRVRKSIHFGTCVLPLLVSFAGYADDAEDRAALLLVSDQWVAALNAGDAGAMTSLITEDVVLLPPDRPPVRGRRAARLFYQQEVSARKMRLRLTTEEAVISGDIGYQMGTLTYSLAAGHGIEASTFLRIWKRILGQWRIHRDMFSDSRRTPKQLPVPIRPPSEPALDRGDPQQ